jgi:cell division septal protein FtsQ
MSLWQTMLNRDPASSSMSMTPRGRSQLRWPSKRDWRMGVGWLLLSATGAGAVIGGAWWMRDRHVVAVRSVRVMGVAEESPRALEIGAYSEVRPGDSWLAINLEEVAQRVATHPFVAHVEVERTARADVLIQVLERTPVALLRANDGLFLMDDSGNVMKRVMPGDAVDLPVLSIASPSDTNHAAIELAMTALAAHRAAGSPFGEASEVVERPGIGMTVVSASGTELHVGLRAFEQKMQRAVHVAGELGRNRKQAQSLYLDDERRPERIAVRLRTETSATGSGG